MKNKALFTLLLSFIVMLSCERIPEEKKSGETVGTRLFTVRYLEEEEARFLGIINAYRGDQNPPLQPLTSSATINQAAYDYSLLMSETGWFDHTGPDGSSPWDRMCAAGHLPACEGSAAMGENIAAGYQAAEGVFEAWRTSPGHNANMLGPDYTTIGIGLANVEGGEQSWVWTTDFSSVLDVDGCACYDGDVEECDSETCGRGIRECLGYCQWTECGPPNPGVDICDGYDNNCNGQIDEGDVCHGCTPELEVCDDRDNDCDGLVDEENVCGTGCEPADEVCDGNDNDCDGTVDEGCACPDGTPERPCGYDVGICRKGTQRCEAGTWSDCEGAVAPRLEICDGVDNNCNGAIDERACGVADGGVDGEGEEGGGGCGCAVSGGGPGRGPLALILVLAGLALLFIRRFRARRPRRPNAAVFSHRATTNGPPGGRALQIVFWRKKLMQGKRIVIALAALAAAAASGCSQSTSPTDSGPPDGLEEEAVAAEEDAESDQAAEGFEDDLAQEAEEEPPSGDIIEDTPVEQEVDIDATDLPFGARCSADSQCASGLCLPESLGGVCTVECDNERSCSFSHVGTSCTPFGRDTDGNGLTDTVVTACAPGPAGAGPAGRRCSDPSQCETRLCLEGGICMNVCSGPADCVPAAQCLSHPYPLDEGSGSYQACGFDSVSSVTTQSYDFGTLTIVTESAGGRLQEIFVPPDAVSLTITGLQTSPAQAAMVGYLEVYDPTNTQIYDMVGFYDGLDPLNWHVPWIRMGIFMVPITPRVTFVGGDYRFMPVTARFADTDPLILVTTDFTFQLKRAPGGTVSSGTLNFNFFFVGLDSQNAASAQVPGSEFQRVLGTVASIYSAAGISVAATTYHDVAEPDRSTYRIVHLDYGDPDLGEMGGLLRLSASMSGPAVNVFFVHDIDQSGVLGVSPGIPGPQGLHGTGASGVIVNYDAMWDTRSAGMVIAHEVGHYLGLFHPTEQSSDPYPGDCIPDTAYGDTSNLMHWTWGGDRITAGQAFVLVRAAVVL